MKNTKKYFKLTFTAILIALMFALSWTVLGMVPLGVASATTIFIPVAVGIVCMDDFRITSILGIGFGVVSLIRAIAPQSVLDPFFINPIVSVLPRFLAAIVSHLIYRLFNKLIIKKTQLRFINAGIAGGAMALFNTLFTISTLILVYYGDLSELFLENAITMAKFLADIALLNMIPEFILGIILTLVIFKAYDKVFSLSKEENDENETEINKH